MDQCNLSGLGISLLLHLLFFIPFILNGYRGSSRPAQQGLVQVSIIGESGKDRSSNQEKSQLVSVPKDVILKRSSGRKHEEKVNLTDKLSEQLIEQGTTTSSLPGSGSGAGKSYDEYLVTLTSLINQSKKYPKAALLRRLEGQVVVSMLISQDGAIHDIQIRRSSGYSILDEEALRAIRALGKVPPLVDGKSELAVEVPIRFEMKSN